MTRRSLTEIANIWKRCLAQAPRMNMSAARERFREVLANVQRPDLTLNGDGTITVLPSDYHPVTNRKPGKTYGTPLPMPENFTGDWQRWLKKNEPSLFTVNYYC